MAPVSSKVRSIVDSLAASADGQHNYLTGARRRFERDLQQLDELHSAGRMLEVGGFPFLFSIGLKQLGVELTTVDLDPARARGRIARNALDVVQCDIERERLPFADATFRTIVLCQTFEHLRINPIFTLAELRRVLHPDGALFLTTPNFYRLGNIVSFLLGRGLAFDPLKEYGKLSAVGHMGHVREYTASEMSRFLKQAGFARVDVTFGSEPSKRGAIVDVVHALLPRIRPRLTIVARPR